MREAEARRPRAAALPERRELTIERVVPGGAGLGRLDGVVALVEGALPGDRVAAEVTRRGRGLFEGTLLEVIEPGSSRREEHDVCPRARDRSCGGCDWPAARLDRHRELKTRIVLDALTRVGGLPASEIPEPAFRPSGSNYRLRNRLHVAGGRVGFYGPRSHDVADIEGCEIVSEALLARLPALRRAFEGTGARGELATLEGRAGSPALGELRLAESVAEPRGLAGRLREALDGVRVLAPDGQLAAQDGPSALEIDAGGATFRVSVSSFFQGNRFLLDAFLSEARAALAQSSDGGRPGRALDLYAGAGFFTRALLERGLETTAVEPDPSATADLAVNLARWRREGLARGEAVAATAERILARPGLAADVVVVDPPRAGLSPEARAGLLRLGAERLVMVSCDPATWARDLKALRSAYRLERLTLLDLFPGTHHVETLGLLSRREG